MLRPIAKCLALSVLPAACLMADFSYEQTTKITGGALAGMVKFAGTFSKQLREPTRSVIGVKGDRMVYSTPQQASIIDLGKETITEINYQKKQYSVMTFAEMAQMLEALSKKSKDQPNFQIKVEAKETGQTKQIGAYSTKEVILKIIMETQTENGQKGGMTVTVDSWLAPPMAGYSEIAEFNKRMGQKLSWAPGGGMMTMGNQDAAKAMAEIYKEGSKLNGLPILQVITMGGAFAPENPDGANAEQAMQQQQAAQQQAQQQQAAQQQQQQEQQQAQAAKPSLGGALGGALGGRLGRFGGLGRKKNQDAQQQQQTQQQQQPQQQQAQSAPAQQQQPAGAPGALMEATSEFTGFSAAPIDPAKFEVPSGFKQVQPDKRTR